MIAHYIPCFWEILFLNKMHPDIRITTLLGLNIFHTTSTTILHLFNEFLKLYIYWSDSTCSEYHLRLDIMKMHIEFVLWDIKIGLLTKRGVHSFHFDKNSNTNQLFFPSNFIENCNRENPES